LPIRANARVLGATLKAGESLSYQPDPARHLYLVAATGAISVNGQAAQARDGVAVTGETLIMVVASADSEIVLVDAS
jgi:redox-sensitive bicupin YhaK (pirin superfamily)